MLSRIYIDLFSEVEAQLTEQWGFLWIVLCKEMPTVNESPQLPTQVHMQSKTTEKVLYVLAAKPILTNDWKCHLPIVVIKEKGIE